MTETTLLLNDLRDTSVDRIDDTHTYIAVGDDNTTPTAGDTTLGNETFRDAVNSTDTSTPGTITKSIIIEASEDNGNDVKEVGTFNAAASGTMWNRNLVNTISKTSDIILYLDIQKTITVTETT
jgi:hypothetical protein